MKITIGDKEYAVHPLLSEEDRFRYLRTVKFNHWMDLYNDTMDLDKPLQMAAFEGTPYSKDTPYKFASRAIEKHALEMLMEMTGMEKIEVTEHNNAEIFFALAPLILNQERMISRTEALSKIGGS